MNNLKYLSLFSIFHHNIYHSDKKCNIDTDLILSLSKRNNLFDIKDFAIKVFQVIKDCINDKASQDISITITGGMDSRVILAYLLKAGLKPNCFTYGNPNSSDVIHAKNLCESLGLKFQNVCKQSPTKEWYYKWVLETIRRDQGSSHLHRAHRTASIAEHVEKYKPKMLFAGHMGGEGLRGLTYNNYFASPFFE